MKKRNLLMILLLFGLYGILALPAFSAVVTAPETDIICPADNDTMLLAVIDCECTQWWGGQCVRWVCDNGCDCGDGKCKTARCGETHENCPWDCP